MKIKALTSFAGVVTMAIGDVQTVSKEVGLDLIKAGYAEEVKTAQKAVKNNETK